VNITNRLKLCDGHSTSFAGDYTVAGRQCPDKHGAYWFVFPDVALPPAGIRFIELGLLLWNRATSSRFSCSAGSPADGFLTDWTAWRWWWAPVREPVPMPLSDVALPPAGIRFIWLGRAEVAGGAGVFALGCAVEGAGCARTGAV